MENNSNKISELAAKVYEGLSEEDIADIERIALDRSNFFGERTDKILEILEGVTDESMDEAVEMIRRSRSNFD